MKAMDSSIQTIQFNEEKHIDHNTIPQKLEQIKRERERREHIQIEKWSRHKYTIPINEQHI